MMKELLLLPLPRGEVTKRLFLSPPGRGKIFKTERKEVI